MAHSNMVLQRTTLAGAGWGSRKPLQLGHFGEEVNQTKKRPFPFCGVEGPPKTKQAPISAGPLHHW